MIFIEFLVKNFKPRYHGNGQQKVGFPIGFFPVWVKANTLRKFYENLWLGVSNDSRWLQRIGIKWYFIAFKMNIISIRKCIADKDVVSDVTCTRQSVITRVIIPFFMIRRYPLNKSAIIW